MAGNLLADKQVAVRLEGRLAGKQVGRLAGRIAEWQDGRRAGR
jgi:hypothetical protein